MGIWTRFAGAMRTAVDTSVLLDLLSPNLEISARSESALHEALGLGELIVCEVVIAELGPALMGRSLGEFMQDWGITFVPSTFEVAELAARAFKKYLSRGGRRGRVVADFLIGAHAKLLSDQLLTTDLGFQRDYFSGLRLRMP